MSSEVSDLRPWSRRALWVGVAVVAVLWSLPTAILINGALRDSSPNIFSLSTGTLRLGNLSDVWTQVPLARMFLNSLVITASTVALVIALGSLAAFGIVHYKFAGSSVVLGLLLSGIMLAPAAVIVPLYTQTVRYGLLNSYGAVIAPNVALGLAASVLLFRNAFLALPVELRESASIDGASALRIYWRICMPLAKPAIVTVAILQGLASWNDYLFPLLFLTDQDMSTVQLALVAFQGQYFSSLPKQFMVMAIVAVPPILLFILAQRSFVAGLTSGAIEK